MPTKAVAVASYERLLADISLLYENARTAVVEAYWEIGKRIVLVEQKGEIKSAYGSSLLARISEDLTRKLGSGFSERNLERMRAFYLSHPKSSAPTKLGWAHYVELMSLKDKTRRAYFEKKAAEDGLASRQIRELVRQELVREQVAANLKKRDSGLGTRLTNDGSRGASPEEQVPDLLKEPKDLTLGMYRRAGIQGAAGYALDCGFYVYREVTRSQYESVTVTDKPSYAYEALVERVIDGDTIWAVIDIGFGTKVREKLRLRGLDCPELGTPEGEAAKRFVAKLLGPGSPILLRTTPSEDKYGRYVADIFFDDPKQQRTYLNNLILQEGLAVLL